MGVGLVLVAVAAVLVVAAAHWYLWRRLVADVSAPGRPWRRVGTVLAVVLGLLVPGTLLGDRALSPTGAGTWLAWPGYVWLALLLYLVLALAVLEIPRAIGRRWLRRHPPRSRAADQPAVPSVRGIANGQTGATGGARDERIAEPSVPDEAWRRPDPDAPSDLVPVPPPVVETPDAQPSESARSEREVSHGAHPSTAGAAVDPGRRRVLARGLAAVAGLSAASTVGYGISAALGPPTIKHVTVPLRRLDPQFDGFRIAVLSDLHLGPILHRGFTERVVAAVGEQQPDLITIVGDLADGSVAELGRAAEPLRRLSAPHGAFFVTGNHEYYSGVRQWVDEVRELGIHPLRNQHTEIIGRTAAFDLAGVNDASGADYSPAEAPNYDAALADRDPKRAVVMLAHQPVQVHHAARHGVDLQLSGHTHGGQLWPFGYAVRTVQPVVSGLARVDGTWLYVTSGVGAWGPPVRVGANPDITMVTLRSRG